MTRILTPFFFVLASTVAFAQNAPFHCGADELDRLGASVAQDADALQRIATADAELENFTSEFVANGERGGDGFVIPVVFHIVHNNGPENITDAQVIDAMRILNEDFNRINPDWDNVRSEFQSIVADIGIEFRLATKDPSGNCTNGITRTVSALTDEGSVQMKALISWPRNKYLQVWVAASANGAAGYTFRPGTAAFYPAEDGIVMQHPYVGAIGTGAASRSRALTHEVGHWLNLLHTWGDGNDPELASNCNQDDNVSDTPNTVGWTSCNLSGTTCGSLDNVENYMDYSYCSKMFTEGQSTRMIAALNSSTAQRNQIWQLNNLINTGVNGNATLCAARFSSNTGLICAGGSVQYTDLSYHNVSSRNWTFPGGTPETSTQSNPTITYSSSGTYSATLQVSDGNGTLSTTTQNVVVVAPSPGQTPPLVEGFEGSTQLTDHGWAIANLDNDNGFVITNAAAYSGSQSARLQNAASMAGKTDDLITPTLDMSAAQDILVTFRYAFARRTNANDDRLRVYVTSDCGETWSLRKQIYASSTLNTAGGNVTSNFIPNGPDQWGFTDITTISESFHVPDMRLRFEFYSGGGNNFYLDDVNINGMPVGLEEMPSSATTNLFVVPNPAINASQVVVNATTSGQTRIDLVDVLGRTISTLHDGTLAAGSRRFELPVASLTSGLYFIRLQQGTFQEVARFVVQ